MKDIPDSWETGFGRNYYNYPGQFYTRDQQCKFSFGKNATYCYKEPHLADPEICEKIWCDDKEYELCVSTYTGATDGTPCDAPHWRGDRVEQPTISTKLPNFDLNSVCLGLLPKTMCTEVGATFTSATCIRRLPSPWRSHHHWSLHSLSHVRRSNIAFGNRSSSNCNTMLSTSIPSCGWRPVE